MQRARRAASAGVIDMSNCAWRSRVSLDRRPERLVVLGMRGWLAGYETGDISCWEAVWNDHARELGPAAAKRIVSELAGWIRILHADGCRSIACYPRPCRFMCRDECLALRMIAGCQSGLRAIAEESALQLVETTRVDDFVVAAESYAMELAGAGLGLQPVPAEIVAVLPRDPGPVALN